MYDATDIVVLGESKFTLGFRLAGVRRFIRVKESDNIIVKIEELLLDRSIGVLVLHKNHAQKLPDHVRERMEYSNSPVVVVVSEDSTGEDDLRRKIKRSIGVDVWDTR